MPEIELSYIIGHKNRTDLLEPNLQSLLSQTNKNFEIIITDNSDVIYQEKLKDLVTRYRDSGLDIKLFFIDPKLCNFSHDGRQFGQKYNPALQQNIAVKKSTGKIVTLTSPEVINSSTNVENIVKAFEGKEKKFILGWIDEIKLEDIGEIEDNNYNNEHMKIHSEKFPQLNGAICKKDNFKPWSYFLGSILRKDYIDIGGMDEEFMAGIAYEDNEFSQRCMNNNISIELDESIVGLHLFHSRSYQAMGININPSLMHNKRNNLIANVGRDCVTDNCIIGMF